MDTRALDELGRSIAEAADEVDRLRASLHLRLRSEYWFDIRADEVRSTWEVEVAPVLATGARLLRAMQRLVGEATADEPPA